MEYVALDLETTGLDPERDRVIEAGAVCFDLKGVNATLERLADPGRSVPEAVLKLTGIDPALLAGAPRPDEVLRELADFAAGRQPVGHGATLDVDFLSTAGCWPKGQEIIDTLHVARILLPNAASHSLPLLAVDLGLEQPRPHRALDDADATRQLFLRLREEASALDEGVKESILALVAPYGWAIARFFSEALTAPVTELPKPRPARAEPAASGPRRTAGATDDPRLLAALIEPEGPLAGVLEGYEPRESQRQMLLAVAQTMQRGGTLVVEAGTGTGKSLAYLIPALARAVVHGERAVVSTNTHTLQEQLMQKDLPSLREWLPWDFQACLLKGRPNYVSLRRWRRYLAHPCADAEELRFKLKILVWLNQTATGDRSELRLQGREEVLWAQIASDPLDCVGVHCTAEDCFVHRARAEAEKADLVVVNHALLLADVQAGGNLIPPYDHLVVDEAHHLEDAATQGLRCEVDGPGLVALLERLATAEGAGLLREVAQQPRLGSGEEDFAEAESLALGARARSTALFQAAAIWVRERRTALAPEPSEEPSEEPAEPAVAAPPARRDETLRLVAELRAGPEWDELAARGSDCVTALAALDARLRRVVSAGREWLGGEEPDQSLRELEIIRGRLAEAGFLLNEALLEPDPNRVYWFTLLARTSNLALRSVPLNVGDLLREHVYGERRSVVLTSASLAVGGSFEYFRSRAGLAENVETLILASPFDYLEQALVCLPTDIPDPLDPDFGDLLVEVVADVARRIGGRTLVLFTSHKQLRETYYALKSRPDLDDVLIIGQGLDGQRRQVLKAFLESERPLLLGTSTFWEGIDVPGDQLSCVILVKLPFPVPTDPVFAARSEQVRDPFAGYALPMAALRLKQGFGRLIRRGSDRGAVVILDRRISSRDYGRAFLEVLPPASRYQGPAELVGERIQEWLGAPEPTRH